MSDPSGRAMSPESDPESSPYVIATGATAVERLELIADLCAPSTLELFRHLPLIDSFLDVGCGIADVAGRIARADVTRVVALDPDPDAIAAGRARMASNPETAHVDLRVGDIDALGASDLVDFDVVYARCLLSHLTDPLAALGSMIAAARPGGLLVIEDVDVSGIWSAPAVPALEYHKHMYLETARRRGAHPDLAMRLPELLRLTGLVDFEVGLVQPILRTRRARYVHAMTMAAITPAVVASGVASQEECDAVTAELVTWAEDDGWIVTLPRLVQVVARVPDPTER